MSDEDELAASVDFGRKATAVVLGRPRAVPEPTFVSASVMSFPPISSAKDACDAMSKLFRVLPQCDVNLLEEQSKMNSDTPLMEAALAGLAGGSSQVIHVPVSRVVNEFGLPRGSGYAAKKRAAVDAMLEYIDQHPESVSDAVREEIRDLSRVHDIADAFLQLLWYAKVGKREISRADGRSVRATDPKLRRAEERRKEKKAEKQRAQETELKRKRKRRNTRGCDDMPRKRRKVC